MKTDSPQTFSNNGGRPRQRIARIVGIMFAIITGLVVLAQSFTVIIGWLSPYSPAISRLVDNHAVSDLRPGVDITHFESRLGRSTYKTAEGPFVEHIFVRDSCYVQAITDSNDRVLFFAVTVRNAEFRPRFETLGVDNGFTAPVQLGVTRFYEWGRPDQLNGWFGASWALYVETLHLPHSDNFVGVHMASSDAGHFFQTLGDAPFMAEEYPSPLNEAMLANDLGSAALLWYRRGTIANTYGESVSDFAVTSLFYDDGMPGYDILIGPNRVRVGALNGD